MEEISAIDTKAILQSVIDYYISDGYRITSQTDITAQMVKPKKFSWLSIILLLFYVFPFLIYLIFYLVQKEKSIYIKIDPTGSITLTDGNGTSRNITDITKIGPTQFVQSTNDPGLAKNTKIVLAILAVITVLTIIAAFYLPR